MLLCFSETVLEALPQVKQKVVTVMAGDHGVVAEGVSAFPQEVTPQMVLNFLYNGAAINVLGKQMGARIVIVDMGVAAPIEQHPSLIDKKIAPGTTNMVQGAAMSRAQAEQAVLAGAMLAAAANRKPVIVDGFISTAAAMIAVSLCPTVRGYLIAGHCSEEQGHGLMLTWLGLNTAARLEPASRRRYGRGFSYESR